MKTKLVTQTSLAAVSALLAALTVLLPDWIEALTGLNPDQGNGSLEWAAVAAFAVTAVLLGNLARREWHKLSAAGTV